MHKSIKYLLFILLFVSMPLSASDNDPVQVIDMDYTFEQRSPTTGWIHFSFTNTTNMQLCISAWEFIQGTEFQGNLYVTNLQNDKFIPYSGPMPSSILALETFFIVPPGRKFPGLALIGTYHDLSSGKYKVQHYQHAVECSSMVEGHHPFTPFAIWDRMKNNTFELSQLRNPSVLLKLEAEIEFK